MFIGARSRYLLCRLVDDEEGRTSLTWREPVRYRSDSRNTYHRVVRGDTLWTLADTYYQGFYNNPADLWWLIADYQDPPIVDPTLRLEEGSLVVIPHPDILLEALSAIRRDTTDLF